MIFRKINFHCRGVEEEQEAWTFLRWLSITQKVEEERVGLINVLLAAL